MEDGQHAAVPDSGFQVSNLPSRWADEHQYDSEPQPNSTQDDGVRPTVTLLHMNPDPLGQLAAFNNIYRGKVNRSLAEVTDDERRQALADMQVTELKAPLEVIKMHWLVEGVDRAFTHQMVRQRTAAYGQESLRFSVMGDLMDATTLPPSLMGSKRSVVDGLLPTPEEANRRTWDDVIRYIDDAYAFLVEHGMPAEEARGLLPHATATRLHYVTDLRNFSTEAGKRLCTQAQFAWKEVFALFVDAIRNYTPDFNWLPEFQMGTEWAYAREWIKRDWVKTHRWQFEAIADSNLFAPVCYQTGKCEFNAVADRSCTIKSRVELNHSMGRPSSEWHKTGPVRITEYGTQFDSVQAISRDEWMLDPAAARKVSG